MQLQPKRIGESKRRRVRLILSFILCVIIPSIAGAIYYAKIASDRYSAGASFVIRGFDAGGAGDLVSSFTGLTASGSTTSDSYIIRRYLLSADLLLLLEDELHIIEHFSAPEIDRLSRFDKTLPFEDFVTYWGSRITTTYDSTTGIVTYEVQAFDADTALELAEAVLAAADTLVNNLSANARTESVRFAQAEVARAEKRLRDAQLALLEFRTSSGTIDPSANAQLDAELVGSLLKQLSDVQAQIQTLQGRVDAEAPILRDLQRREAALQAQIDLQRQAIGAADTNTTNAERIAEFESLQIEQTFSQQRYASALTSLEQARLDADRQQRYLAVFSRPLMPQDAIYPERLRNSLLVLLACFTLWAIGTLVTYAVRDHLR
ncbi:MAG: hypothetical protein CR993_06310 [Rhodobacterales bacterium]|nr:MAG: hypothetical protein CR993_06310 [Rhodobacterales bacterium]